MEYIGMDVHNRYCQVAILDDDTTDPDERRIKTERAELEEFAREHQGAQIAIEATRNHWFVYDCLEQHLDVSVANPHETGLISEQKVKSDRLDAKRLAVLLRVDALSTSYVPPDEFRDARKLVRRRKALVEDRTAAKNRVRAALADRGITYDGDLFGQQGREFLTLTRRILSTAEVTIQRRLLIDESGPKKESAENGRRHHRSTLTGAILESAASREVAQSRNEVTEIIY